MQRETTICYLALVLLLPGLSLGFVSPRTNQPLSHFAVSPTFATFNRQPATVTMMSTADDNTGDQAPLSRRRRRKRKVQVEDDEAEPAVAETKEEPEAPVEDLKPRDDTPVQLQVQDVRDIVGISIPTPEESEPGFSIPNPLKAFSDSASPSSASSSSPLSTSVASSSDDSSLEQLLQDARRMQEEEGDDLADSDEGVKGTIRNILSTIVTVDFFIVCGFLVWFLAGIVSSSFFGNDDIQILFNNNFEKLVQPALGVLMIAALAGNFFKEEEEGAEGF